MNVYDVIERPLVTEKGNLLRAYNNQYVFKVDWRANKIQVREAVEKIFGVDVISVQMIKVPGKRRRYGRYVSNPKPWKKAVVRLAADQRIEFFDGV